ncbi:MAG: ABC transporter permease [Balneolaceae bacterium]
MSDFNLERAIQNWKKSLNKHKELEPGDISELESHLIESVDMLLESGLNEESAFKKATEQIEQGFEDTLEEYRYTSSSYEPTSKWLSSWWIPELLPNVLKVAVRNFKRQPGYSLINICGLALGMASCLMIFLYVSDELSYDNFHEQGDRIYRIDQVSMWDDFESVFSGTGPGVAPVLKSEIPEIESFVRINNPTDLLISVQRSSNEIVYFEESEVLSADSTFFDIFSIPFIEGDKETALDKPYSFVITEKTAERYFGEESALGKTITLETPNLDISYEITGVVEEMPNNSHFSFDLVSSLSSYPNVTRREDTWLWTAFTSYVLLKENSSIEQVRAKLDGIYERYAEEKLYSAFGYTHESFQSSEKSWELFFVPLQDIHLKASDAGNRLGPVSDMLYIYVFSTVALLIIALASINFMNLSSARSVQRAKEVGIRKTLGSMRGSLILQFLAESVVFSIFSLLLAFLLMVVSIDTFNSISSKSLSISNLFTVINIAGISLFTLLIGLISGIYPALYITSYQPIEAFKSKLPSLANRTFSFASLRNFLVVFQFAISIMLVSCSIIIYQQLDFIQNKHMGYDKDQVLVIENMEQLSRESEVLKQSILQEASVIEVGQSNSLPPQIWNEDFGSVFGSSDAEISLNSMVVDDNFIPTMGFEILQGKEFDNNSALSGDQVVLNETAVRLLKWSDEAKKNDQFPLGKLIHFSGNEDTYEVIGVIKDFNLATLHEPIRPIAIFHDSSNVWRGENSFLTVRFNASTTIESLITTIEAKWASLAPNLPFDYTFLDARLYQQYESERKISKVVSIFTGLAILIAILGLIGLISFTIEKKTKEIGVRKVMGASAFSIVLLLSKDMIRLILASLVIAVPISWYLMSDWLTVFNFRIDINPIVFVSAGLAAILLAWLALSFQTIKAALQNPVKSLRSE